MLYWTYHQFLDGKDFRFDDVAELWLITFSRTTNALLAALVEKNQLRRRYIKKFLGRAQAEKVLKKLHAIYEQI